MSRSVDAQPTQILDAQLAITNVTQIYVKK
jgi:hypothetical protein